MIYLDNAATSWPKPPGVAQAMADFLEEAGGNPGRSGHRLSIEAGRIVYDARERIAELFNLSDPLRVIFTLNATHAINLALQGLLVAGDRIVTTAVEHNAVMRPLRSLEARGVEVSVMQCEPDGSLSLDQAGRSIRPGTKLVVATHANNVTGTLLPITAIAEMAHAAGASLLVDAAQTAGVFPIDIQRMGIDLLAFTGHKGLMGPPGTGGLILGERLNPAILQPLMRGGTGSRSEFELQPDDLPDKFEAGTPNSVGIAGLGASVAFVVDRGVEAIRAHEVGLTRALLRGLADLPTVRVYGPTNPMDRTAVVSFVAPGLRVSEVGLRLDEQFDVLCRVGLHCAPATHRTLGTFPEGTVRLAPGVFTEPSDIAHTLASIRAIVEES